jgi:hypothetical protein
VIVNGTHNVYQSVYWTSGAITYTLPLIINTFSLAIFIRVLKLPSGSRAQLPVLGLLAGLCVLAAGCSPLFAVVQVAAWFFLMVGCWLFIAKQLRRAGLTSAATAFIFAGIGFLLVALAPGNALRRDNFGENLSLLDTIIFSARMTVAFILADPFILIPLMVAALLGGRYYQTQDVKSSSKRLLQLVSLTVEVLFVLVFLGFFTGVFATNQSPPLRSRIVMHYTVVISVAVIGFVSGYSFAQWLSHFELPRTSQFQLIIRFAAGAVILIVGSSLLQMTLHTLNENVKLSTYAAEWDAMEAQLQVADADDEIVLQPFTYDLHVMAVLRPISASTDNRCMRNYYGVKSIQMLPKASGSAAG